MRLVIRDNLTNELLAIVLEDLPEGMNDNEIQEWINDAPGMDDEMLDFLQNENYYLSYEEDTGTWH